MRLTYDLQGNVLILLASAADTIPIRLRLRQIGGWFDRGRLCWMFPAILSSLETVRGLTGAELTPEAVQWSEEEAGRLRLVAATKGSHHIDLPPSRRDPPRYDYQDLGVSWLLKNRACLLLDDVGLGKTRQAIDAASAIFERSDVFSCKAVIVCPNSLKWNWKNEIGKWSWQKVASNFSWIPDHTILWNAIVPDGSTKTRVELIRMFAASGSGALILNYESLRYFPDEFYAACLGSILICDEAHRLKTHNSVVSKIIAKARPARLWLLTATLTANGPEDVWHPLNLVRPGILEPSYWEFGKKCFKRNKFNAIYGYQPGYMPKVKTALATAAFGRKKDDCLSLPPVIEESRIVDLDAKTMSLYANMKQDLLASLEGGENHGTVLSSAKIAKTKADGTVYYEDSPITKFLRLRQITDGLISEGVSGAQAWSGTTKIEAAIEAWKDAGRPPVIFWCQFVPVVHELRKILEHKHVAVWHLTGEVEAKERFAIISEWQRRNEPGALVCQMDVVSEGLNLQHAAHQIFVDLPLTPLRRIQCIGRSHRSGQKDTVVVTDILARGTIDMQLQKILKEKVAAAEDLEAMAYGRWSAETLKEVLR